MSEIDRLKVVFDTSVFISALLWKGTPHQLLILAEKGSIKLYATPEMLGELEEVLKREKFMGRITKLRTSATELMMGVISLVEIVGQEKEVKLNTTELPKDEDDVIFLQCAIAADVHYLVSGDEHLLDLKQIRGIPILPPSEFLRKISTRTTTADYL